VKPCEHIRIHRWRDARGLDIVLCLLCLLCLREWLELKL